MISRKAIAAEWPLWIGIVGVCAGLIIAGALPANRNDERYRQQTETPRAQQSDTEARKSIAKGQIDPAKRNSDPKQDNQQGYGIWNRLVAILEFFDSHNGSFSALAAIAVAVFTFFLVHLTRRQLMVAEKAADAAVTAAKISEQALLTTQRALIAHKRWDTLRVLNPLDNSILSYKFFAVWENTGPTHARECRNWIFSQHITTDGPIPHEAIEFHADSNPDQASPPAGARIEFKTGFVEIPVELLTAVREEQSRLFIWARIDYRDMFDGTPIHTTEVCAEATVHGDPSGVHDLSAAPQPNLFQYRAWGPQNRTT